MTVVASALLALISAVNFRVGRSLLYPPALYCCWWSLLLLVLSLSGDAFYPLSVKTLSVYVLGAFAFTVGGSLRYAAMSTVEQLYEEPSHQERVVNRFLVVGAVILVIAFPLYWHRLQELRAASFYTDFWRAVRHQTSSGLPDDPGFGPYRYLLAMASFMSLIAVYHANGSRRSRVRAAGIIAIALLYHFLTAARLGAMTTLFGVLAVSRMRSGRVNWKMWLIAGLVLLTVFSVPAILLQKGGDTSKGWADNAAGVLLSIRHYAVGGLVGFNQVIDDVSVFPPWLSFRFFFALARTLGFDVDVPVLVLPFTETPIPTNVYTIYGSYFADFGWVGVAAIMCVHGYVVTMLFQAAVRRRPEAVILFGVAVSQLLSSAATDAFFVPMSYWIQAILCTLAVYRWPLLARRRGEDQPIAKAIPNEVFGA